MILAVTAIISFLAFSNGELMFKSFFIPVHINERKEFWRFFSHGFIHADMNHLFFNMLTLYFFGPYVEQIFGLYFGFFILLCIYNLILYFKIKEI